MVRANDSEYGPFATETERHYTDSMRCSKETKTLIMENCAPLLLNMSNCSKISHGVILKKLAEFVIQKYDSVDLPQELINKIMVDCKHEYFKYHPDEKGKDIPITKMIEIMATHYIESDPR